MAITHSCYKQRSATKIHKRHKRERDGSIICVQNCRKYSALDKLSNRRSIGNVPKTFLKVKVSLWLLPASYNLRLDSVLMMITMIALLMAIVMSDNIVFAAQRDSSLTKHSNGMSNNGNSIPSGSGNTSNENVITANDINAHISIRNSKNNSSVSVSSNRKAYINNNATPTSLSATDSEATLAPIEMLAASSTTTSSSTSGSNSGSSFLQKSTFSSNTSGANRNTIEVTEDVRTGPYFDKAASKNITALLGKTAYLNCRVKNLGNKTMLLQVSWVRHRDIHLLTVGRYTYTSDQRFRAIHQPQTEDWILQIKYPQHRDSGIYECQVSTTPHMSHYIHLNVVEPSTEIIGAPDLYIESGSTINLTCVILNSPEPPAYIFWNHNNAIINYDSPRGGVSVVTNKGETTTSFLLIKSARPSDSGHYQCNPSNAKPKSVTVHVLNGEFPAAMQRAGQSYHRMSRNQYLLVYLSIYFFTLTYITHYMQVPVATGIKAPDM